MANVDASSSLHTATEKQGCSSFPNNSLQKSVTERSGCSFWPDKGTMGSAVNEATPAFANTSQAAHKKKPAPKLTNFQKNVIGHLKS